MVAPVIAPVETNTEAIPTPAAKTAPPQKSPPPPPAAAKVIEPTAEQLARWKLADFKPLQLTAFHAPEKIGFVSFISPVNSGQEYLLGGTRLTMWSLKDSNLLHEFIDAKTEEDERLLCFAVSPDKSWGAAGDAGGLLRKFDFKERQESGSQKADTGAIVRLAISTDGREIATVSYNREITIWDAATIDKKSSFTVDARDIKHLQYLNHQELIAAGESMSTWNTSTGKKLNTFPSEKYQTAITLSGDGKRLVFGADGFLQIWNLTDGKGEGQLHGVPYRNAAIRFSDDGSLIAIATPGEVRILDNASGNLIQVIDATGSAITDVCWIPQSKALLVATDMARVRVWGDSEECRKLGIEPLPEQKIDTTVNSNDPAFPPQNYQVLDLRLLPKLPNSKPQHDSFALVNYSAPAALEEVKAFYSYVLSRRGWEVESDQSNPNAMLFSKNNYRLRFMAYGAQPNETYVNLSYLGNYELQTTPRLSDVTATVYEDLSSVIYKTSVNLLQAEVELLKKLHAAGWTHLVRLNRSQPQEDKTRTLEFLKAGTLLLIRIQPDPADEKILNVHYTQTLATNALPVPPDAGVMEWDDFSECQMIANTGLSLENATAFYEESMQKQGWVPGPTGKNVGKDFVYLPYYNGQRDVGIALSRLDNSLVRIVSGKHSDHSWQPLPRQRSSEESESASSTDEPGETSGIEAADVPILHAANAASYDSVGGSIRFELAKIPLADVAKEYEVAFQQLGWTAKPFGEPTAESIGLHFEKDGEVLSYQSSIDPVGKSNLTLSGSCLKWTKPIAPTQLVSYASWLRNQKLPASLKSLEAFEAQMKEFAK